jgi:YVTN family beta-propeller protein
VLATVAVAAVSLISAGGAHAATTSWQQVNTFSGVAEGADAWVDDATQTMYVTEQAAGDVAVVDLTTNTITAHITVGANPTAITYNPDSGKLYVTNVGPDVISVIDPATNAVVDTIATPHPADNAFVGKIAVNTVTNRLYIPVLTDGPNDQLMVVDGTNDSLIATINIPSINSSVAIGLDNGVSLAVDEATNTIYVSEGTANIGVYNGATNTFSHDIPLGGSHLSQEIVLNPVTHKLYVGNQIPETVSVIDLSTSPETVLPEIPLGTPGGRLAVDPVTNTVFDATNGTNSVTVINGATDTVTQTVPVGGLAYYLYLDATNHSVYAPAFSGTQLVTQIAQVTTPTITSAAPAAGSIGTAYSATVTATGTGPITFSVTSGSLPAGLSLDPTTGVISGHPTTAGTSTFTITATNAYGTDTQTDTLTVSVAAAAGGPATAVVTPTAVDAGYAGHASSHSGAEDLELLGGALILGAGGGLVVIGRRRGQHG